MCVDRWQRVFSVFECGVLALFLVFAFFIFMSVLVCS